jgi:hypothetical protein
VKRTPMKRRTPLRQRRAAGPDIEREPKPRAEIGIPTSVKPLRRGTYAGGTAAPAPKTEAYRDPALLEMARGRPCLLLIPGICSHRVDTVVAAHSNLSVHGKGGARKADDCFTVAACHACHSWLDQGPAPAAQKAEAFRLGHALQVMAWQNIAAASDEPQRFRAAARRALERLKGDE